jgi:AcrR family transcriptional regulator
MTKDKSPRPLRRDAQRNRERILAAARELFAERGVDATLDDVAARAGVGVGTVYRRYANKDALLDELFEEGIAELATLAEESLSNPDPWRALIRFLERLEEGFVANRALEQLVLHTDRGQEQVARARDQLMAPIEALVERAKADGRLRADFEAEDIAMIHTMLAAVVRETHALSPELWRRYFAMIVDGLASKRSSPSDTGIAAPLPGGR